MPKKQCELPTCDEPLTGKQTRFCGPRHRLLWHRHHNDADERAYKERQDRIERRYARSKAAKVEKLAERLKTFPCLRCGTCFERACKGRPRATCGEACKKHLQRLRRAHTAVSAASSFAGFLAEYDERPTTQKPVWDLYQDWSAGARVRTLDRPAHLIDVLNRHGLDIT